MSFNRQQAFNDAVSGLWSQQALSKDEPNLSGCLYRGPNGTKCAVGWLIPDEKYHKSMEGMINDAVLGAIDPKYGEPNECDEAFLEEMQAQIHDDMGVWDADAFKTRVKDFARDAGLEVQIDMEC